MSRTVNISFVNLTHVHFKNVCHPFPDIKPSCLLIAPFITVCLCDMDDRLLLKCRFLTCRIQIWLSPDKINTLFPVT